jgi:hypothetical protein
MVGDVKAIKRYIVEAYSRSAISPIAMLRFNASTI